MSFGEQIGVLFGENRLTSRLGRACFRLTGLVSHAFSDSLDAIALALRVSLFRQSPERAENKIADSLSYRLGEKADAALIRLGKQRPGEDRHARKLYRARRSFRASMRMITGNLSFALLMLVLGVCFVFAYLLWFRAG